MNKTEFIQELANRTGFDIQKCTQINNVVEEVFIIGKNNKDKLIDALKSKLNLSDEDANHIYEVVAEILSSGVLDKIKNFFNKEE